MKKAISFTSVALHYIESFVYNGILVAQCHGFVNLMCHILLQAEGRLYGSSRGNQEASAERVRTK